MTEKEQVQLKLTARARLQELLPRGATITFYPVAYNKSGSRDYLFLTIHEGKIWDLSRHISALHGYRAVDKTSRSLAVRLPIEAQKFLPYFAEKLWGDKDALNWEEL